MPAPRRKLQATVEETLTPPASLKEGQYVCRVKNAAGNNLYNVELPNASVLLAELEARFRSTIWLKRGGFVVIDSTSLADRGNKLDAEIINVVRDEKAWRKMPWWPKEFEKRTAVIDDGEEKSTVGKLPPTDDDDED